MPKNIYVKITAGIFILILLLLFVTEVIIEPWIGGKIQTKLNEKFSDYIIDIDKVQISVFNSGIELENITIGSKQTHGGFQDLKGEIASIKFNGINLLNLLLKKGVDIREVTISNSSIQGKIPSPEKKGPPTISPVNVRIDSLSMDKIEMAIENTASSKGFAVQKGALKMYDLQFEKQDTLSLGIVKQFDFNASQIITVSSDSMYTFTANEITCSTTSNTLFANRFSIHPNYKEDEFTARHEFQTDRFDVEIKPVFIHNFSAAGYFKSGDLVSSFIEIGNLEVNAFRDKRKKFRHVNKPAFQDMLYNYPGLINIDSIGVSNGKVTYTEHGKQSNEPGKINFSDINAKIYKITNDTLYKTEKAYFKFDADALLMGKGKLNILLKGRLFDHQNTFSLNGTLSGMKADELNPMLEKNAFIYATSGKIDAMNFSFTANNTKASGHMTLLYHELDIAVKNKRTDDTTAIKERVVSLIANIKVMDSNPLKGEKVRVGIIDQERDPERFLINYCFKSILTGIKTSIVRKPKK